MLITYFSPQICGELVVATLELFLGLRSLGAFPSTRRFPVVQAVRISAPGLEGFVPEFTRALPLSSGVASDTPLQLGGLSGIIPGKSPEQRVSLSRGQLSSFAAATALVSQPTFHAPAAQG